MAHEYARTATFRGVGFTESDLNGATFRDCDLRNVRITSSAVDNMHISGFDGRAGTVVVDDVVVTDFVAAELDRRHPERVQLRAMRTADDFRTMWATLEGLRADTLARAELLPEDLRHERVNDEWSLVETLRHLVFAIDSWVGRVVLGEPAPFHRLALPHTDFPADAPAQIGIEVDARPSYAEVVAAHDARRDEVRAVVAAMTDDELEQVRTCTAMPGMDNGPFTVGTCLRVVLNEHSAHRRYAVRDLAALEARTSTPT
jgi:uncharacterized damage-inducible protein DinB